MINIDHIVSDLESLIENCGVLEFGPQRLYVGNYRIGNAKLTLKMRMHPDSIKARIVKLKKAARRKIGTSRSKRGMSTKQSKYCKKMADKFEADGNLEAYMAIYE